MSSKYIFQRIEMKYIVDKETYNSFLDKIKEHIIHDEYSLYTLCNLYFDTDNYDVIRTSVEKPKYKEKIRLRSYGVPSIDTTVFLELKKKYEGTVYKRRISLSLKEAYEYIYNGIKPDVNKQILNEIDYFLNITKSYPKIFLAYDREAFVLKENPLTRITFDKNIRYRKSELDLTKGDHGDFLFENEECIMEIKSHYALPLWFVRLLSELKIYPTSFSKYGNVYKKILNLGD